MTAVNSTMGDVPVPAATDQVSLICLESESKMWIDDIASECVMKVYRTSNPSVEIVALAKGNVDGSRSVPARVHSECFTGDILGSKRCDCGQQLHNFLRVMHLHENGVLLYIRGHEGRGIGLANKIRAYQLQDRGLDTVDANLRLGLPVDTRNYEDCLAVLRDLGVRSVTLYTNNPDKIKSMEPLATEVKALASIPNERNLKYLKTKMERCAHRTVLETFKLPIANLDVSKLKIGVVHTSWNDHYVKQVLQLVQEVLVDRGADVEYLVVPGASDLVAGARALIRKCKPQAVVALGVLIRGASDVYEVTCAAIMSAITNMNANQDVPIISGCLMCRDEAQAEERTHGKGNPGRALAETALHMASLAPCADEQDAPDTRKRISTATAEEAKLWQHAAPPKRQRGMSETLMM